MPAASVEAAPFGSGFPQARGVLRLADEIGVRLEQVNNGLGGEFGLRDDDFDALTDLFMGDQRSSKQPADRIGPGVGPAVVSGQSVLRLAECDDDRWTDAHDSMTAAFVPGLPVVEVLLLAHLPVLASAWAVQYARDRSREETRPIGVLRIQGGRATVEVVAESGLWRGADNLAIVADSPTSLDETLRRLRGLTDRWIVRLEGDDAVAALDAAGVDRVTVLTGTDDAAVAGGFKVLKQLAGPWRGGAPQDQPRSLAQLRLLVVGGDDARAELAARRLANAARAFLERDVELLPRCGAIRSTRAPLLLFSGRCDLSLGDVVARLRPSNSASDDADNRPQPVIPDRHEQFVSTARPPQHGASTRPDQPAKSDLRSTIREVLDADAARIEQDDQAEAPSTEVATTGPDLPGALASHVQGLTPVAVRSPYDRTIEFAVDDAGGLHLLAWAPHGAPPDAAACSLLTAARWADDHAELIAPLLPGCRPRRAECANPDLTLHLMTDEPRLARRLLDTEVRVHLLDAVPVHGQTAWYCRALN